VLIDCDRCAARPAACSDCVVGVLLGTPEVPAAPSSPGGEGPSAREPAAPGAPLPVEFGPVERRALEVLADHGLIPRLRLVHTAPEAAGPIEASPADRAARSSRPRRARDAG
jgi:hypothetical protein